MPSLPRFLAVSLGLVLLAATSACEQNSQVASPEGQESPAGQATSPPTNPSPARTGTPRSLFAHPSPDLTPNPATAGGEITASGQSDPQACETIRLRLLEHEADQPLQEASLPVAADGSYQGNLSIPADLAPGTYTLQAACIQDSQLAGTPTTQTLQIQAS